MLGASGVPASTYHYNKLREQKAPTRPELWEDVAWSISEHQNMMQQKEMLAMLLPKVPEGASSVRPIQELGCSSWMGPSCR